jgi:site-specific recombinase
MLNVAVASRTETLAQLTRAIEHHQSRDSIRSTLRDFWSHHSYVRVISEAGLPDEAFLVRELLARAVRHLLPVDEVEGDLYVLMDSLNLKESDARWVASLPESLVASWADTFRPSTFSILASCKILALRAANVALSRDLIVFANDEDITKSPFFHLPSVVEHVIRHPEDSPLWQQQRAACEAQLQTVNQQLANRGSSANLIFRMRLLRSLLGRIQQVITLERPDSDAQTRHRRGPWFCLAATHRWSDECEHPTVGAQCRRENRTRRQTLHRSKYRAMGSDGTRGGSCRCHYILHRSF